MDCLYARSAALSLCLLATACGGGGSEGDSGNALSSETARPVGQLVIEERSGRYYLDAWFAGSRFDADAINSTAQTVSVLHDNGADVCEIRDDAVSPVLTSSRMSAGESVDLVSRSGLWASVLRQDGLDTPVYASELRSVRSEWPDDLVVEVPGDDFPAMPSTPLDPLQPLIVLAPTDRVVPTDGRLEWSASTDSRDHIELVMRTESAGGASDARQTVYCRLQDDGEFVLPAAVSAEVDWIARAARVRDTQVELGDTLFKIAQVSER